MISTAIKERLDADPFHPFAIRSSSGVKYHVANPGLVVLMKSEAFVAAPNSDRWTLIPYLHIAGIESSNGNGKHPVKKKRRRQA